ncbi:MAG: hypothetical protein RBG13Loki_2825, partial [Promethearchaeota archaeon CR_4]
YSLRDIEHFIIMPYEYATIIRFLLNEQQIPFDEVKEYFSQEVIEKLKVFLDLPQKS